MANEMKAINRTLFAKLEKCLPFNTATYSTLKIGDSSIRYIGTIRNSRAQDIIKHSLIHNHIQVYDKSLIFVISFEDKRFLVISGDVDCSKTFLKDIIPIKDFDNEDQNLKENPGIISIVFSDSKFPTNIDEAKSYVLMNDVFSEEKEGILNGKFNPEEIKPYFYDFGIWEIGENYPIINSNSLLAFFSALVVQNNKLVNLVYSKDTKISFEFLIEELPIDLIGGNIYRALTSMEWKHSFLELYQCIEFLYPVPFINELAISINKKELFPKLFEFTESDLNWKPKEFEALTKILNCIKDKSSINEMYILLKNINGSPEDESENKIAYLSKHIYLLRNSIAHFRASNEILNINDSDWDKVIEKINMIIFDIYNLFSSEIESIK